MTNERPIAKIGKAYGVLSALKDAWGLLIWLIPAAPTIMTTWAAIGAGLPLHQVMFYATGVFAYVTILMAAIQVFRSGRNTRGLLAVVDAPVTWGQTGPMARSITPFLNVRNFAKIVLYFRVVEFESTVDGKANPDYRDTKIEGLLAPDQFHSMHTPVIAGLEAKSSHDFRIRLRVRYGPRQSALRDELLFIARGTYEMVLTPAGPMLKPAYVIDEMIHRAAQQ